MNLFGEEFEPQPQENKCAVADPKKSSKKGGASSTTTTAPKKEALEEKIPSRNMQVKMYSDFYMYEAPEDLQEPTLDDVRKWMLNTNGFTELTDPKRVGMTIITPEGEGNEPYIFCGVRFEKMG